MFLTEINFKKTFDSKRLTPKCEITIAVDLHTLYDHVITTGDMNDIKTQIGEYVLNIIEKNK